MATTFEELEFGPHAVGIGGVKARAFYPNGYGASVVRFDGSYGYEDGLYELAVLKGAPGDVRLCYDTPITYDVEGYLTPDDVTRLLGEVAALPAADSDHLAA